MNVSLEKLADAIIILFAVDFTSSVFDEMTHWVLLKKCVGILSDVSQ